MKTAPGSNTFQLDSKEAQIIEGCLGGQALAQKQLYDRYKDAMYTICYRITGDRDVAADALQEGFLAVFRSLPGFRAESTLGAWLKTIIVRTACKVARRYDKEQASEDLDPVEPVDWGNQLDAEYLEKAILGLPPGYRRVFVMIEVEGYSHQEVGDMLGISAGTSKSQLHYAKKTLRKKLEKIRAWS